MKKPIPIVMFLMSLFFTTLFLATTATNASANDRYISFDGQGIWSSDSSSPAVEVSIKGRYVYAQFVDENNFPALRLKRFNSSLLNEYTEQFVKLQDYNKDGYLDIAVLKSASYGGDSLCYSVFNFLPNLYTYDARKSMTVCEN
ncbi:MAG: hypothetical protein V3V19_08820 [Cocleimonas sp.]